MDDWPLVGRASELACVADSLRRPECSGLILAGGAGVGKTRLARESIDLATRAGFTTVQVTATRAASSIPFGALAPLVGDAIGALDRGVTARALAAAADAIAALGGAGPLLVFADDAHHLDEPSAALLHQLATMGRVFLLGTMRTGDTVVDAFVGLWKDGTAERIDIAPLPRADVDQLVSIVLGGPVDGATLHNLWRSSGGNVLYLRELLAHAVDTGTLRQEQGVWRVVGDTGHSPRLVELIADRLAGLSVAAQRCLELVALGEPVEIEFVTHLSEAAAVSELERTGLVELSVDGRRRFLRLTHPLYGDVTRTRIPRMETARLSSLLADEVERAGARRRGDLLRVVTWRLAGGDTIDAALLLGAARQAWYVGHLVLAERLARAALLRGGGIEAHEILGGSLDGLGRHDEADEVMAAADPGTASDKQRARLVMARASNLLFGFGDYDGALQLGSAAEAALTDPVWRDRMAAHRARFEFMSGHPAEALATAERLLAGDEPRSWLDAGIVAIVSLTMIGRASEAVRTADTVLADLRRMGVHPANAAALTVPKALALIHAGRLEEAETLSAASYRAAVEFGAIDGQGWFSLALGRIALYRGELTGAIEWFTKSALLWTDQREPLSQRWCLSGIVLAHAARNDLVATRRAVEALDACPGPPGTVGPDAEQARAWALLVQGQIGACRTRLYAAADLARDWNQLPAEAAILHDLARIGFAAEVVDRLATVASADDGRLVPLRADHTTALAGDDPEGLEAAASGFASMGALLLAAEAAAHAGAAWRRAGQPRRATLVERSSSAYAESCGGAATPALAAPQVQAALTSRERQIALLASQGLASKAIGLDVGLSSRTVDNYLQRIFDKLGVHRRDELAGALALASQEPPLP